jgi:four helix bundle protein
MNYFLMNLKNFKTFQLANSFYQNCNKLRLPPHLKDQLDRASSSIALNLAEGSGKSSPKDRKRFYSIALGSLRESTAILILANINDPNLDDLSNQLGACLYTLVNKSPSNNIKIGPEN